MSRKMRTLLAALGVVVVAAAPTLGQTSAGDETFQGFINDDSVNIRSGASTNHYPVMKVDKGTVVTVHKAKKDKWDLYGWYIITPPEGAFSYISKKYVQLGADGKTGTVTGSRVMVRAPAPTDPNASYKVQKSAGKGDKVQVIGEAGDYLKIKPLPGVRLYVKKELVTKATAEQLAAAKKAGTEPKADTAAQAKPSTDETAPRELTVDVLADGSIRRGDTTHKPDQVAAAFVALAEAHPNATGLLLRPEAETDHATVQKVTDLAEKAGLKNVKFVVADLKKPKSDKPETDIQDNDLMALEKKFEAEVQGDMADADAAKIAGLQDEYRQLLKKQNLLPFEKRVIEARLGQLGGIAQAIAERQEAIAIKKNLGKWDIKQPKSFLVTGVLRSSAVYTGRNMPLLYRVVDPATPQTRAYVQPNPKVNLSAMLGMRVGIAGFKRTNPTYNLEYIVPTSIEQIRPEQDIPISKTPVKDPTETSE
ncbi:MAG: biopolymer transporter ExbD [Phycisphaeraceae bacterium]|nr:biopolymer transporter ExbD [Phycisphaeraceae bacterium]